MPPRPLPVAARRFALVAVLASIPLAARAAAPPVPDPVEGKWWGRIVASKETVDFGLEIARDAKGELQVRITQPGANYFAMEYPEVVRRDGDKVSFTQIGIEATLAGDVLRGTMGPGHAPVELHRVASLPTLPPLPAPPAVPTGPGPRWQTRLNGQVFAAPAVADGVAYVGTTGGVLNAVRTSDGEFVWAFAAGRPIFGAARVDGDALYFTCDNGWLFKLERATGKELWRYDLGDARVSRVLGHPQVFDWDWQGVRPLVAAGVVYAGSGDGSLHAVDAATGARRWRAETGGKIRGGAAIEGDRVFVGSADHFVYAFDRASGRELWKHDTGADVENEPLVADGKLFVGNRGVGLIALATASGDAIWRTTFWGSWLESTPTLEGGVLYVGSSDLGRVSAIDPADGRVLWRGDVFGWSFGTPLLVGDRVYEGAAGGTPYMFRHVAGFCVLDRATGRLLRRWPLPDSAGNHQWGIAGSLALAGDTVVATTIDGSIYGFPVE